MGLKKVLVNLKEKIARNSVERRYHELLEERDRVNRKPKCKVIITESGEPIHVMMKSDKKG